MTSGNRGSEIVNRILIGLSGMCVLAVAFFILPMLVAQPPGNPPGGPPGGPEFGGPGGPGFGGPGGPGFGGQVDLVLVDQVLVGPVLVGPGGRGFPPPVPAMTAIDKNNDGEISAEELAAAPDALRGLDKNKDGLLSGDEIMPPMGFGGQVDSEDLVVPIENWSASSIKTKMVA